MYVWLFISQLAKRPNESKIKRPINEIERVETNWAALFWWKIKILLYVLKCHTCIACMNVFHDNRIQFSISYWLLLSDRNLQIFANFDQQIACPCVIKNGLLLEFSVEQSSFGWESRFLESNNKSALVIDNWVMFL